MGTLNFFFFSFVFLGLHLLHMEVPRLGVKSEMQLPAYTTATAMPDPSCLCDLYHSSWQCRILNPLSEAKDWTCVLMDTNWLCYRWAMMGTPNFCFLIYNQMKVHTLYLVMLFIKTRFSTLKVIIFFPKWNRPFILESGILTAICGVSGYHDLSPCGHSLRIMGPLEETRRCWFTGKEGSKMVESKSLGQVRKLFLASVILKTQSHDFPLLPIFLFTLYNFRQNLVWIKDIKCVTDYEAPRTGALFLFNFFSFYISQRWKANNIGTVAFAYKPFFLLCFPICKNGEINSAQLNISSEQCLAETKPWVSGSYFVFVLTRYSKMLNK